MKRQWTRPEVTILVRGTKEELVLSACKGAGSGPSNGDASCRGEGTNCPDCYTVTNS